MLKHFNITIDVPDTTKYYDENDLNQWRCRDILQYIEDSLKNWSGEYPPDHPLFHISELSVTQNNTSTLIGLLKSKYHVSNVFVEYGETRFYVKDQSKVLNVCVGDKLILLLDEEEYWSTGFKGYISNYKMKKIIKVIDDIMDNYHDHLNAINEGRQYKKI